MTPAPVPQTKAERIALLREAIKRSGLSNRKFAEKVLVRDERTVRRWLAGDGEIPDAVARWLLEHNR